MQDKVEEDKAEEAEGGAGGQEVGDKDSLPGCFQAATRSHRPVETAGRRQMSCKKRRIFSRAIREAKDKR